MAESVIFVLIVGILAIFIMYSFGITNFDPRWLVGFLTLLVIPGFYAAITSGPFVPSSKKRHRTMIKLAELTGTEVVYDLGCGDGRLVFQAARRAKKATGFELSIPLYLFGKFLTIFKAKNAHIRYGNIWKQDYSDADVIFCYLLPKAMKQFAKEVWPNLKPGTRVISNAFQMHEIKPVKQEDKVYIYQR